jgi:hypothetical protein
LAVTSKDGVFVSYLEVKGDRGPRRWTNRVMLGIIKIAIPHYVGGRTKYLKAKDDGFDRGEKILTG